MKILVLNCGSSSVKYKLFDIEKGEVMAQGGVEKIGLKDSFLKLTLPNGEKVVLEYDMPEHRSAIRNILNVLTSKEYGCIASYDEIDAVGHRLVHGGEKFNKSVLITKEVIDKVKECYDLAPLHNPANVTGVEAIEELLPSVPQVGVFDTAFHQTMPKHAFMYALPYEVYEKYGVRRYGFHGTSHRYVSRRACEFLGVPYEEQKIITCHIGNGASITAIDGGKVVDTSMGLTPLEGLVMGTRSGDVDPSIVTFLMDHMGISAQEMADILNKKSGIQGMSGVSSDMREIDKAVSEGNERAALALNVYCYRIRKYIGAYTFAMGGVDAIIFTAGVGEHQASVRYDALHGLESLGIKIDEAKNNANSGADEVISAADSKVTIAVIGTDEELLIAKDTEALVSGQ